jgi:hypothetical protein
LARTPDALFNGVVAGWFPREEVTLLLGALMALGCLTLGIVELLWPAGVRRVARARAASVGRAVAAVPIPRPAAAARPISSARLIALVDRARAETDPERRTTALRVAILTIERWRAGNRGPDEGVAHALERARAEQWANYQRIALRRLASAVPWRATALRVGAARMDA